MTRTGESTALTEKREGNEEPDPLGQTKIILNETHLQYNSKKIVIKKVKGNYEINPSTYQFIKDFYLGTSLEEWNNWQWQIKNSITDYSELTKIFGTSVSSQDVIDKKLPFRITPYYASVVYNTEGLQKSVIPNVQELICSFGESIDPLGEDHDSPVSCIVHRYPDRVLFLTTSFCSTNCRYCTRSRIVGNQMEIKRRKIDWDEAMSYIRNNPQIRDVVISGGDPLTLSDISLEYLLSGLRSIPHVEIIRIGTKVPVVLPMRITRRLLKIIRKYHPVFMSIHFTHPDELTTETNNACNMIADAGIVMGSQTVLLKDINDAPEIMKKLMHGLLKIRVKPYYLYQCDPIVGSSHFRTSVEKGIAIIESLRGWTSGYAIPSYVIDAPGGGGKIPLLPEYYEGKDENGNIKLRNYEKKHFLYYNAI